MVGTLPRPILALGRVYRKIKPAYYSGENWRTPLHVLFISWEATKRSSPPSERI